MLIFGFLRVCYQNLREVLEGFGCKIIDFRLVVCTGTIYFLLVLEIMGSFVFFSFWWAWAANFAWVLEGLGCNPISSLQVLESLGCDIICLL